MDRHPGVVYLQYEVIESNRLGCKKKMSGIPILYNKIFWGGFLDPPWRVYDWMQFDTFPIHSGRPVFSSLDTIWQSLCNPLCRFVKNYFVAWRILTVILKSALPFRQQLLFRRLTHFDCRSPVRFAASFQCVIVNPLWAPVWPRPRYSTILPKTFFEILAKFCVSKT